MADLIVKIGATSKEFEEELKKLKKKTEDFTGAMETAAKVSGAAFLALGGVIGVTTSKLIEGEAATAKLAQAMKLQGNFSQDLINKYKDQIDALEAKTGADDAAIASGFAFMQSMLGQTEISDDLSRSVLDLAAGLGIDVETAFNLVGKTLGTSKNALAKYGVEIDASASKQEKIGKIIEFVNGTFGGQAEAATQGLGQIKLLGVAFENFEKALGEEFKPLIVTVSTNLKNFFSIMADNKTLVEMTAKTILIGAALTGLTTVVAGGALAFVQIRNAMLAGKIVVDAMTFSTRALLGATGVGLLIVVLGALFVNWSEIWPKMQAIFNGFITGISEGFAGLGKILKGVFNLDAAQIQAGVDQIKAGMVKSAMEIADAWKMSGDRTVATQKETNEKQLEEQRKLAQKLREEKAAEESRMAAIRQAEKELRLLEVDGATKDMVALKKQEIEILKQIEDEKNAGIRGRLRAHLAEVQLLEAEQSLKDAEAKRTLNQNILAGNEEHEALSDAQKETFRLKHEEQLMGEIQTADSIRKEAALNRAKEQIKAHNEYLENERKFGSSYAFIAKAMHSEIYRGTKSAFSELSALQQSDNIAKKNIGKAAAVANITIKSAESAMNIYAGFSTIPFVGQALGIAGAFAALAFGHEQIDRVLAANQGGIVPGVGPDADSRLSYLTPGELVVPRKNFNEVVNSVAQNRMSGGTSSGGGIAATEIVLTLKNDLMNFIEAQIVERKQLNMSLLGAT